ncbi:hypothetical protein TWF281_001370 [Arthrobotrys megalospora]
MSSTIQTTSTDCSPGTEFNLLRLAMDPSSTIIRRYGAVHIWRSLSSKRVRQVEKLETTPPLPRERREHFIISDGALELTKWIAMVIMTADHVNKYLFDESLPFLFEIGRIAMPLFVLVLAYNLARQSSNSNGAYLRTARRLSLCGTISSIPYMKLGVGGLLDDWYPLNIFFTLLVITTVTGLMEQSRTSKVRVPAALTALTAFFMGGGLVEFWWPAVGLGVGAWIYFRSGRLVGLLMALGSCGSLHWVNGNDWALAAFPILFILSRVDLQMPRLRWFFYAYYPAHLFVLLLIRIPMTKAGYVYWYT